jgi:hypothetical protein
MKCETLYVGPGVMAIVCGRRQPRKRCSCGELTDLLCDYPVGEKKTKPPKRGDARTNIHNRKVFYVWEVDTEKQTVTVSTKPATLQAVPRNALGMTWATWWERTRPSCDKPVCRRCVVRLGTLDICAPHGRELARQAKASEG